MKIRRLASSNQHYNNIYIYIANTYTISNNTACIYELRFLFLQIYCRLKLVVFKIEGHLLPIFSMWLILQRYGGCNKRFLSSTKLEQGPSSQDSPCQPKEIETLTMQATLPP